MEAVIGILLSLILAIVLGILMDCFPLVRQGIYPLLVVTQTVPMIVLAPILIIYMGFGIENPDRYPDVLLPDRRQLLRRSGTGR